MIWKSVFKTTKISIRKFCTKLKVQYNAPPFFLIERVENGSNPDFALQHTLYQWNSVTCIPSFTPNICKQYDSIIAKMPLQEFSLIIHQLKLYMIGQVQALSQVSIYNKREDDSLIKF